MNKQLLPAKLGAIKRCFVREAFQLFQTERYRLLPPLFVVPALYSLPEEDCKALMKQAVSDGATPRKQAFPENSWKRGEVKDFLFIGKFAVHLRKTANSISIS
jgi:hypothetical protein